MIAFIRSVIPNSYNLKMINILNYSKRNFAGLSSLIDIKPDVYEALKSNGAIVALESTIISHGMPYPHNLETAIEVEETVRREKAIPATIAIINGRIKVGLTLDELKLLANNNEAIKIVKTSRRDLAYVLSKKWSGGTTVAGTLIVANMVGINVMATGGIGGVHRDGHNTMDVSADLIELGKSSVAVISSGVKSILDIPRTLEFLETQGVFVASFQSSNYDFPAFYSRSSGAKAPYNFDSPLEAAEAIHSSRLLNLGSGMLIAVPVPEKYAMNEGQINKAILNALQAADKEGISGKEATPFLLSAISKITQGKSLATNMALIKNNASVASQISVELSALNNKSKSQPKIVNTNNLNDSKLYDAAGKVPVVIGGSIIDTCFSVLDGDLQLNGATYNSEVQISGGGVGRNMAEGIWKLYKSVYLISVVGNDQNGDYLKSLLPTHFGQAIEVDHTRATANFAVVLDKIGDCKLILGDMDIHSSITPELIIRNEQLIEQSPLVVMDGNILTDTMGVILEICGKYNVPVLYEPTDMHSAGKPFQLSKQLTSQIKFITPNITELKEIARSMNYEHSFYENNIDNEDNQQKLFNDLKRITMFVNENIDNVIVTLGSLGLMIGRRQSAFTSIYDKKISYINAEIGQPKCRFYEIKKIENIMNVSGAGDSFASGFISAMLKGFPENICVSVSFEAAKIALMSPSAVPKKYFDHKHVCWKIGADFIDI